MAQTVYKQRQVSSIAGPQSCGWVREYTTYQEAAMHELLTRTDATEPVNTARFQSLLSAPPASTNHSKEYTSKFRHHFLPTLSHFLAMTLHPKPDFFPPDIHLLVLDGLDTLINLDYPRYQTHTSMKPEQQRWQAGRRYAILGSVISALNKLAVVHNMAVIVTTSCSTRMRTDIGLGAALVPGVGGAEWEAGVWNRLVVFRDFSGRFVGVQKCQGKTLVSREGIGEAGRLVPFDMASNGRLQERELGRPEDRTEVEGQKQRPTPVKPPKRSFDEIADSEDEDVDEYGWADADDQALVMEGLDEAAQTTEPGADPR